MQQPNPPKRVPFLGKISGAVAQVIGAAGVIEASGVPVIEKIIPLVEGRHPTFGIVLAIACQFVGWVARAPFGKRPKPAVPPPFQRPEGW